MKFSGRMKNDDNNRKELRFLIFINANLPTLCIINKREIFREVSFRRLIVCFRVYNYNLLCRFMLVFWEFLYH